MTGDKKKCMIIGLSVALAITLIVLLILLLVFLLPKGQSENSSILGVYQKAGISSNGVECAEIGTAMLKKDGSAVDAAIATLLCEGVASLHSMGLGGGFLMTIYDTKTRTSSFLDAREVAPIKATRDMFKDKPGKSIHGGLAVAVPGELKGYWEAHRKYGKLEWSTLFEPVIALCEKGSLVTRYLANYLTENEPLIRKESTLTEILINPVTNSTWETGDRIKRPMLAKTLREIAVNGIETFYNGPMGNRIIQEIRGFNGIMTMDDLKNYTVKWTEPLISKIGNLTMYSAPPPGSGAILSFIMNVLGGENFLNVAENIKWQRIVETFKWAYARRADLGDPAFEDIYECYCFFSCEKNSELKDYFRDKSIAMITGAAASVVSNLTSPSYANEIRKKIDNYKTWNHPNHYGLVAVTPQDSGTSHVSVLDENGLAVSVTSTINQVFGAMIRSNSTGIIFNDEMDDFSTPGEPNGFDLPPSVTNFIKPRKRPMSSMTPTIIVNENNEVRLVIGAAGGTKITTAVAIGLVLNLWSGYNIKEAIDASRIHHQLIPMNVQNEKDFDESVLNFLKNIGHNVTMYKGIGSAITAVSKESGLIFANSDYRRQGRTAGI